MMRKREDLLERLLEFAARIGKLVDALPETRMGRHVAGQIARCGTSPAPNYAEACGAESRKDFIHKLSICLKELRESHCWIRLIVKCKLLPESRLVELADECQELMNIIAKSIVTTKANMNIRQATRADPIISTTVAPADNASKSVAPNDSRTSLTNQNRTEGSSPP